jgi:AcrR family transcriptional regulator
VLAIVECHLREGATFADISVVDVVAEAGISRSTFYAYFVDKSTLLCTWYEEFTEGLLDAAQTWWTLDATATRADVTAAFGRIIEAYRPHRELMAATHEAIGGDHGIRAAVEASMEQYVDGLRVHIETGQAGGFIDPSLPAHETAYWLQWMAERGLHIMARPGDRRASMGDAYAGIVWNTLYAPTRR